MTPASHCNFGPNMAIMLHVYSDTSATLRIYNYETKSGSTLRNASVTFERHKSQGVKNKLWTGPLFLELQHQAYRDKFTPAVLRPWFGNT